MSSTACQEAQLRSLHALSLLLRSSTRSYLLLSSTTMLSAAGSSFRSRRVTSTSRPSPAALSSHLPASLSPSRPGNSHGPGTFPTVTRDSAGVEEEAATGASRPDRWLYACTSGEFYPVAYIHNLSACYGLFPLHHTRVPARHAVAAALARARTVTRNA